LGSEVLTVHSDKKSVKPLKDAAVAAREEKGIVVSRWCKVAKRDRCVRKNGGR